MYNSYNPMYMQELQNMRDRIDRQLQFVNQNQPPAPITQNFQLAPNNQNNSNDNIHYANNVDDVKKELVFNDTLFINKERTLLWVKNASGDVKTYGLKEIIELDEKDLKINELMARIKVLEEERANDEQYVSKDVNGSTSSKKSTNGKSNTTSHE